MKTENTKTVATINYEAVKKALALTNDFALVNDIEEQANKEKDAKYVNYVSIHCIVNNKIDNRKVFCIYLNKNSVTIHCAKRFEKHCNKEYKLNSKKTEYTKQVALTDLKKEVDALLKLEIASMKKTTTVTEKKATEKKAN